MFCSIQHVKRQVRLSSKAQGGDEQGGGQQGGVQQAGEEVQGGRAEADVSKGTAMLSALASGSSLNLSQELVVRDCCFKWKQGRAIPETSCPSMAPFSLPLCNHVILDHPQYHHVTLNETDTQLVDCLNNHKAGGEGSGPAQLVGLEPLLGPAPWHQPLQA